MKKILFTICLIVVVLCVSVDLFNFVVGTAEKNVNQNPNIISRLKDPNPISLLVLVIAFLAALIFFIRRLEKKYNIDYARKNPLINDVTAEVISINGDKLNDKEIGDFLTGNLSSDSILFKLGLRISFADQNLTFDLSLDKSYLIPYKRGNKIKVTLKVDTCESYDFGFSHHDTTRSLEIYMGSELVGAETLSDYKYSQLLSLNYHLNPSITTMVGNLVLARLAF